MSAAKERTVAVTKSVVGWLVKRGYSCHIELAVLPWGKRRADVVALNYKRHLIIVEVKQSWPDFDRDAKWHEYLEFANQFYFAFPHDLYESRKEKILERVPTGIRILVLGKNGLASVVKNSKHKDIPHATKRDIITRLAWRGGLSKRNTRRLRVYL